MGAIDDGYAHYPLAQWRNGQWAEPMLSRAGTEAVRLVPFSSLLRLALYLLANTYLQHGACRCAEMRYAS